ncbi:MAG TPA: GNAT family N-acetyltransferase [Polyangiaceae bacterium]|nr:GNAT family N-acetyltransferase [Polyangiaceae bacterium]
MNESRVRRATPNDIPAASELAGKLARMHHDTDPERFLLPDNVVSGYAWWFERVLKDPEAVLLVADGEGSLAGYAYGGLEDRAWNLLLDEHGAIHDVYVADDIRRHGVGRALVGAMVAALEELGAERIVLSTMPSNLAAQSLFARFGFRATFLEMTRNRRPAG